MTPEQQILVQTSFAQVAPIADAAASLFYDDLFQRDPRLRTLFKTDMAEQRRKPIAMLGTAVANLQQWDKVQAAVQALGRRPAGRGTDRDAGEGTGCRLHPGGARRMARLLCGDHRRDGGDCRGCVIISWNLGHSKV